MQAQIWSFASGVSTTRQITYSCRMSCRRSDGSEDRRSRWVYLETLFNFVSRLTSFFIVLPAHRYCDEWTYSTSLRGLDSRKARNSRLRQRDGKPDSLLSCSFSFFILLIFLWILRRSALQKTRCSSFQTVQTRAP